MSTKTEIISYDKIIFNYYKNKHLILYVLIGVFSIGSELYIKNTFNIADQNNNYFIPFIIGVIICFTLNFFLNFNIPNYFFFVSLFYFFLISIISYSFQYYVSIIYDYILLIKVLDREIMCLFCLSLLVSFLRLFPFRARLSNF